MGSFKGGMGGFGGGNMQNLMKQAQKMQEEVAKAEEELENTIVEGESGSGLVKVEVTGKKLVETIKIDPKAVDIDDLELLEDLIIAAFNSAYAEADKLSEDLLGPLGAGKLGGLI